MARWLLTFVVNRLLILAALAALLAAYPIDGCRSPSGMLGDFKQSAEWLVKTARELQ